MTKYTFSLNNSVFINEVCIVAVSNLIIYLYLQLVVYLIFHNTLFFITGKRNEVDIKDKCRASGNTVKGF